MIVDVAAVRARYRARDDPPVAGLLVTDGATIAAVDLGSNSFRLEIGRVAHGQVERVEYLKEMVRLGGGLDGQGNLSAAAMQRGWDCLARFAERIRGFEPAQVRVVATQTFREARNRAEFLAPAQRVLGFPIEVISGREEARLIYSGVAHLLPGVDERRLVVDIGGRSTEVVLGRGYAPRKVESYPVGSVSASLRHFGDGRLTRESMDAATLAAQAVLEDSLGFLADRDWDAAYGSSGTVGAIADILGANGQGEQLVTSQGLDWLAEQLVRAGHVDRLRLEGLKEPRRGVIAGGVATLRAVFTLARLEAMHEARGALRHGVLYEMLDRQAATLDVRERTVQRLQQKFGADAEQAARVRAVAALLFTQLVGTRDGTPDRAAQQLARKLGWAAEVHEIGRAVAHDAYHRHGAYILEHSDSAGFALHQLQRLGVLVLGQRGGLRKVAQWLDDVQLRDQLLCLRLAVLLCHARRAPSLAGLMLARRDEGYRFEVDAAWAGEHPRSVVLLADEAAHWKRVDRTFECIIASFGAMRHEAQESDGDRCDRQNPLR